MSNIESSRYTFPEGEKPEKKSPFLFVNPETFVTPEMREWLSKSTIDHKAPLWLTVAPESRKYGGVEDVVMNIVSGLSDLGAKEQFIFGNPGNKVLEGRIRGVKVFTPTHVEAKDDLLYKLRNNRLEADQDERIYVLGAYEASADHRDEITIIHDHTNYGRDHGIWVSQFIKPVIRTEHGPLIQPDASRLEELALRHFENRNSMSFVAISESQKNQMPGLNWAGVVYNGVDMNDLEYREKKGDDQGRKYLVFLGRINEYKGTHNAVEVAKKSGIRLVIAGQVEDQEYFDHKIKPHIDGNNIVYIEGGVDVEGRKKLLAGASALLMLIEWPEPFGMVMAESLASGTPVIGFRQGSVPEVIKGNTGAVVDTTDQAAREAMAAISDVFSSRECRERAERYFSKEKMTAEYVKLYMKMTRAD